jgi:hypothetical protein
MTGGEDGQKVFAGDYLILQTLAVGTADKEKINA